MGTGVTSPLWPPAEKGQLHRERYIRRKVRRSSLACGCPVKARMFMRSASVLLPYRRRLAPAARKKGWLSLTAD